MKRKPVGTAGLVVRFVLSAIVGAVVAVLVLQMGLGPAKAHPMPDSEIVVTRGGDRVDLTIRVPMDDLLLAMKDDPAAKGLPRDAGALLAGDAAGLKAYVAAHVALEAPLASGGKRVAVTVDSLREVADEDEDVGHYSELEVKAHGFVAGDVPLVLAYDLVLGRVANHRALVSDAGGKALGVIRYSLAEKKANALPLPVVAAMGARVGEPSGEGSLFDAIWIRWLVLFAAAWAGVMLWKLVKGNDRAAT